MTSANQCWEEIELILKKYNAELIHHRHSISIISVVCPDKSGCSRVLPSLDVSPYPDNEDNTWEIMKNWFRG